MAETHLTDNKPIRIAAVYVMLFRYRLPNEFGPIRSKKKKRMKMDDMEEEDEGEKRPI